MFRRVAIAVASLTAIFALSLSFYTGWLRLNYPSASRYPIQGIDVSHHQGPIDWRAVAQTKNVRFTFIKATEGGDFKDSGFVANWENAGKAGLVRGAYHFFTFCRSGLEQARNFLSVVPQDDFAFPVAIDLEFKGNCQNRPSPEALATELKAFIAEVHARDNRKPIFYVTQEFFDRYLKDNESIFPDHDLWLRNVFYEPRQDQCERWALWQYADRARIDGIATPVDLNALCPDNTGFQRLFG